MKKMTKMFLFLFPLVIGMLISAPCLANTTKEVFQRYPHDIFIESGSYEGDGIAKALEAGYKEVYSIELSQPHYQHCCKRFEGNPNVHLYEGDSAVVLKTILAKIDKPATFWLDGHYSWYANARGDTNTPLLKELEAIASHPIKTHTILINDVREFGTVRFDFLEISDAILAIKKINPNYEITYDDGVIAKDILVASIPTKKIKTK